MRRYRLPARPAPRRSARRFVRPAQAEAGPKRSAFYRRLKAVDDLIETHPLPRLLGIAGAHCIGFAEARRQRPQSFTYANVIAKRTRDGATGDLRVVSEQCPFFQNAEAK